MSRVKGTQGALLERPCRRDSLCVLVGTVSTATGGPGHVPVGTVPTAVASLGSGDQNCQKVSWRGGHGWVGRGGDTRASPLTVCAEDRVAVRCATVSECVRVSGEGAARGRRTPASMATLESPDPMCRWGRAEAGAPALWAGQEEGAAAADGGVGAPPEPGQRQAASSPLPGGTRPGRAPCSPRVLVRCWGLGAHAVYHTVHTRGIYAHHTYDIHRHHTRHTHNTHNIHYTHTLYTHCLHTSHTRDIYTHPTHTTYTHTVHPTHHTQHIHAVMYLVLFPAEPRLTHLHSLQGHP